MRKIKKGTRNVTFYGAMSGYTYTPKILGVIILWDLHHNHFTAAFYLLNLNYHYQRDQSNLRATDSSKLAQDFPGFSTKSCVPRPVSSVLGKLVQTDHLVLQSQLIGK